MFAMHGHEITGPREVQHQFEFFLAGVAVNVNPGDPVVQYLGALAQQVVDGLADGPFVPRNRCRGDDYRVPFDQVDISAFAVGDSHQRRSRLALTAGRHQHDFVEGQVTGFSDWDDGSGPGVEVAHLGGHLDVGDHASTHESHFAVVLFGSGYHLLDSADQRSEGGDDSPARGIANCPIEGWAHDLFRRSVARQFSVGGIGHQQQDSPGAAFGQSGQVDGVTVHRGVVDLEIPV